MVIAEAQKVSAKAKGSIFAVEHKHPPGTSLFWQNRYSSKEVSQRDIKEIMNFLGVTQRGLSLLLRRSQSVGVHFWVTGVGGPSPWAWHRLYILVRMRLDKVLDPKKAIVIFNKCEHLSTVYRLVSIGRDPKLPGIAFEGTRILGEHICEKGLFCGMDVFWFKYFLRPDFWEFYYSRIRSNNGHRGAVHA